MCSCACVLSFEVVEDIPLQGIVLHSVVFMCCVNTLSSVVGCEVVEDTPLCGIVVTTCCVNMFSCVVSCEVVEDTPLCGIATLFSLHKSLDKCDFAPSDTTLQLGNKPAR